MVGVNYFDGLALKDWVSSSSFAMLFRIRLTS